MGEMPDAVTDIVNMTERKQKYRQFIFRKILRERYVQKNEIPTNFNNIKKNNAAKK